MKGKHYILFYFSSNKHFSNIKFNQFHKKLNSTKIMAIVNYISDLLT